MICREVTKDLEVPHEPGNVIVIRKLAHPQIVEARTLAEKANRKHLTDMTPQALEALREGVAQLRKTIGEIDATTDAGRDRMNDMLYHPSQFDRATCFKHAVKAWSGPLYDGQAVDDDNLAALDIQTADWLHAQIVEFFKPAKASAEKNV